MTYKIEKAVAWTQKLSDKDSNYAWREGCDTAIVNREEIRNEIETCRKMSLVSVSNDRLRALQTNDAIVLEFQTDDMDDYKRNVGIVMAFPIEYRPETIYSLMVVFANIAERHTDTFTQDDVEEICRLLQEKLRLRTRKKKFVILAVIISAVLLILFGIL